MTVRLLPEALNDFLAVTLLTGYHRTKMKEKEDDSDSIGKPLISSPILAQFESVIPLFQYKALSALRGRGEGGGKEEEGE